MESQTLDTHIRSHQDSLRSSIQFNRGNEQSEFALERSDSAISSNNQ